MIDRIRIDQIKRDFGCESVLFGADYGNSDVRSLPLHLAPPPPPEEKEWVVGQFSEAMPLLTPSEPKANALRGKHPSRIADAPPCPYCGSHNTWSKHRNRNGSSRRVCQEENCGKSFTFEGAA